MEILSSRFFYFITFLIIFVICEFIFPWKKNTFNKKRWMINFSMILLANLLILIIYPLANIQVAFWAKANHLGLFHYLEFNSSILLLILSILILDLSIYFQHYLFHKIPFFWKFHQIHHSDDSLDISTALRFHPIEIIFSVLYKNIIIIIFGIDPKNIIIFEIILNSMSMFNHSNFLIKRKIERVFRLIIVTPQMHYTHHSILSKKQCTNYGFNFSFWDRIFRSYYLDNAKDNVGLNLSAKTTKNLLNLILLPFKKFKQKD